MNKNTETLSRRKFLAGTTGAATALAGCPDRSDEDQKTTSQENPPRDQNTGYPDISDPDEETKYISLEDEIAEEYFWNSVSNSQLTYDQRKDAAQTIESESLREEFYIDSENFLEEVAENTKGLRYKQGIEAKEEYIDEQILSGDYDVEELTQSFSRNFEEKIWSSVTEIESNLNEDTISELELLSNKFWDNNTEEDTILFNEAIQTYELFRDINSTTEKDYRKNIETHIDDWSTIDSGREIGEFYKTIEEDIELNDEDYSLNSQGIVQGFLEEEISKQELSYLLPKVKELQSTESSIKEYREKLEEREEAYEQSNHMSLRFQIPSIRDDLENLEEQHKQRLSRIKINPYRDDWSKDGMENTQKDLLGLDMLDHDPLAGQLSERYDEIALEDQLLSFTRTTEFSDEEYEVSAEINNDVWKNIILGEEERFRTNSRSIFDQLQNAFIEDQDLGSSRINDRDRYVKTLGLNIEAWNEESEKNWEILQASVEDSDIAEKLALTDNFAPLLFDEGQKENVFRLLRSISAQQIRDEDHLDQNYNVVRDVVDNRYAGDLCNEWLENIEDRLYWFGSPDADRFDRFVHSRMPRDSPSIDTDEDSDDTDDSDDSGGGGRSGGGIH